MASYIGRVGEFCRDKETFCAYVERMEMFYTANNIVETPGTEHVAANRRVAEQKKAIFLAEVGPEVYSVLSNLLSPAKPKDTSLVDIVQTLKNHYDPAPLEITESFHFGMRNQQMDESISDYIVALKTLSIHCNYGEFLNRALRDRFVCGLNNVKIQNKLLNTSSLTFDTACHIAISMELAERNSREFRPSHGSGTGTTISVNKVSSGDRENSRQPDAKCSRCNGNHSFRSCRFKSARCFKCQQVGHIASACKSGASGRQNKGRVQNLAVDDQTPDEDGIQSADDELGIFGLFATNSGSASKGYLVEVKINGESINMEVDTAADFSIMSRDTYIKRFKSFPLQNTDVKRVERGFTVNEPVRVRITDRGFTSQSAKWSPGVVLEVCGDRWYLVQMGAVTKRVHADHLIRALDNQKMSADLGNSFVDGSCLQEFQSVPEPVGVKNQENASRRTDEESSQSGVVPSMSGNDYTVPIAGSPVAKETEVEGHPEMTLSLSEPLRRSTRVRKPVVRLNL